MQLHMGDGYCSVSILGEVGLDNWIVKGFNSGTSLLKQWKNITVHGNIVLGEIRLYALHVNILFHMLPFLPHFSGFTFL